MKADEVYASIKERGETPVHPCGRWNLNPATRPVTS